MILIHVLGCDLEESGSALGPETRERCVGASELYFRIIDQGLVCIVTANAGMAPGEFFPEQRRTMGVMMGEYLAKLGVCSTDIRICKDPTVWASRAEIERALMLAAREPGISEVTFVSSWYHIPRIAVIARRMRKKHKPRVILTFKGTKTPVRNLLKNVMWECIKFPAELLGVTSRMRARDFYLCGCKLTRRP